MTDIDLNITDCDIEKVMVYRDRAEIHRSFALNCHGTGEFVVKIKGITDSADMESIRVKGIKYGEILEVNHDTINAKDFDPVGNSDTESSKNELLKEITRMENEIEKKKQSSLRNFRKRDLIQTYAEGALGRSKDSSLKPLDSEEMMKILECHSSQLEILDELENQCKDDLATLRDEIHSKKKQLLKYSNNPQYGRGALVRVINIILDVKTCQDDINGDYKVYFSYVVSNATWNASYDLRVSPGGADTPSTMELYYYAEVMQSCGEDWNDCQLILSTSNPTVGASPPPLVSKEVVFETGSWPSKKVRSRGSAKNYRNAESDSDSEHSYQHSLSLIEEDLAGMGSGGTENTAFGGEGHGFAVSAAVGSGDAGSTTFIIQRNVTIAADSKPHKVTVTIQTLAPQIIHYVVPSESASVYLQAKTKNTSSYPILPSSKVSVYYDGNFIANSNLKQASSGESFNVFLGVDPAVKCDYMPVRVENRIKGWLSGKEEKRYHHTIVLHNTKQIPCKIIVAEILPKSSNAKINVELLEPSASQLNKTMNETAVSTDQLVDSIGNGNTGSDWPSDFVSHNKYTNNIIWLQSIDAGSKVELTLSYRIAWSISDGTVKIIEK